MDMQIDQATARRLAAEERARVAAIPPLRLEDVVVPGSLASFVGPGAWVTAQDLARELDATRAELAAIVAKQAEVAEAAWMKGARRVVDVSRMAEIALSGGVPTEAPDATPEGLVALSAQALQDLQAGLAQKQREKQDHITWLTGRLRAATRDVLKGVAVAVADRYGQVMEEVERLHTLLSAADGILGNSEVTPGPFKQEKFIAPMLGKMKRLEGPYASGTHYVANFETGSGVIGLQQGWKAAIRAVTGQADLG